SLRSRRLEQMNYATPRGARHLRTEGGIRHRWSQTRLVLSTSSKDSGDKWQSNFWPRISGVVGTTRISWVPTMAVFIAANCLCSVSAFHHAMAATAYNLENPNRIHQLNVAVGKSDVIQVDTSFGDLLVGDAGIADVVPLTTTSFYVLGKKV